MSSSSPLDLLAMWYPLVNVPHPLGPDSARDETLTTLHAIGGYALLAIAGLHAQAAMKHHFLDRGRALTAMLQPLSHPKKRR